MLDKLPFAKQTHKICTSTVSLASVWFCFGLFFFQFSIGTFMFSSRWPGELALSLYSNGIFDMPKECWRRFNFFFPLLSSIQSILLFQLYCGNMLKCFDASEFQKTRANGCFQAFFHSNFHFLIISSLNVYGCLWIFYCWKTMSVFLYWTSNNFEHVIHKCYLFDLILYTE